MEDEVEMVGKIIVDIKINRGLKERNFRNKKAYFVCVSVSGLSI